jgi:hypothetical protein
MIRRSGSSSAAGRRGNTERVTRKRAPSVREMFAPLLRVSEEQQPVRRRQIALEFQILSFRLRQEFS